MRARTPKSSRAVKILTALAVLALAGALSGLAAAGSSPATAPAFTPDPIPAKILGPDVPVPIPSSVITETNGWLVSNGYNLVAVYAGAAGSDSTQGRVVIVRQDLRTGSQTVQIVDAGPTGPLTITPDAPIGAAVETTALTGGLPLGSPRGTKLKLNLATDTIGAS
jgi:hypothetical protein